MKKIKCLDFLGYPNYYAGRSGNIYKKLDNGTWIKRKFYLSPRFGYYLVNLYNCGIPRTFRVPRLIAMAWIPNPKPNGYDQVNHKDGNKQNNKVSNLEWCNLSENIKHAYKHGLWKPVIFQKHSKPVNVYTKDRKTLLYEHVSSAQAARNLKCSINSIRRAVEEYGGVLQRIGYYIEPCNDYPLSSAKKSNRSRAKCKRA